VGGIARLGELLVELRHAPDPRVLVEVALVQLSSDPGASGDDIGALAARVTQLEQAIAAGAAAAAAPVDPATGRAALGGRARPRDTVAAPTAPTAPTASTARVEPAAAAVAVASGDIEQEWNSLRPTLKGRARALYTPVDLVGATGDTVTLAVPNAMHRSKCEEHRGEVEESWQAVTGRPVRIDLVVRDDQPAVEPMTTAPPDDLIDDGPVAAMPSAIERLAQAFPGAELVEGRE
jgi:DNA polymerase-3 subunit gamma/tau